MKFIAPFVAFVVAATPAAAFSIYKPARVLMPEMFGVTCEQRLCVDHPGRRDAAEKLLTAAKTDLSSNFGLTAGSPRAVFCSTDTCRNTFGLGRRAGFALGSYGVVIAPRGWQAHYVAHELVHHWQAEHFGSLALLTGQPWLIEGMAYALSADPRETLSEPFETYRRKFLAWHDRNRQLPLVQSVQEVLEKGI